MKTRPLRGGHRESRLLPVSSQPVAIDDWLVLSLNCPRRGRIGLEVCVDCALFWRARDDGEGGRGLVVECGYQALEGVRSAPNPRVPGRAEVLSSLLPQERFCLVPALGVREVANLFRSRGLDHAPVVDTNQRPIGLVRRDDLGRESPGPTSLPATVRDVMHNPELILSENTTVVDAAARLLLRRAAHVIVVSASGKALGALSAPLLERRATHAGAGHLERGGFDMRVGASRNSSPSLQPPVRRHTSCHESVTRLQLRRERY